MHRSAGKIRKLILAGAVLVALASCATVPEPEYHDLSTLVRRGEIVYLGVDVARNRDLIGTVMTELGYELQGAVNRVDFVVGSIGAQVPGTDGLPFSGVAVGQFPKAGVRYALRRDRTLTRTVDRLDGGRFIYYRSTDAGVQIAVPMSGMLLISTSSVADLAQTLSILTRDAAQSGIETREELPVEVAESLAVLGTDGGYDLFLYVPRPRDFLEQQLMLSLDRFPVQTLRLAVFSGGERLELRGDFGFETGAQAELFGRLGRVFVLGFVRSLGLDTAALRDELELSVEGDVLHFTGITLSPEELAGLVSRFTGQGA